jgi:hypothetical protein
MFAMTGVANCSNIKVRGRTDENQKGSAVCGHFDTSPAKIVTDAAHQVPKGRPTVCRYWYFLRPQQLTAR